MNHVSGVLIVLSANVEAPYVPPSNDFIACHSGTIELPRIALVLLSQAQLDGFAIRPTLAILALGIQQVYDLLRPRRFRFTPTYYTPSHLSHIRQKHPALHFRMSFGYSPTTPSTPTTESYYTYKRGSWRLRYRNL